MRADAKKGGREIQFLMVLSAALALMVTPATPSGSVRGVSWVQAGYFVVVVSKRNWPLAWYGFLQPW